MSYRDTHIHIHGGERGGGGVRFRALRVDARVALLDAQVLAAFPKIQKKSAKTVSVSFWLPRPPLCSRLSPLHTPPTVL